MKLPRGHLWLVGAFGFLLLCHVVRPDPVCPPVGWTCLQEEPYSEWSATCTLPGLEGVVVTYKKTVVRNEETMQPESQEAVNIDCGSVESNDVEIRLPESFLSNFTGFGSVSNFRIAKCILAANSTLASVLGVRALKALRYSQAPFPGNVLNPSVLRELDRLRVLRLERMGLAILVDGQFALAPTLVEISLKMNGLQRIPPEAFVGLPNLTKLDLSNNNITELSEPVAGLANIKMLLLFNNRIATLSRKLVGSLPNLEILDLQGNQIETLADDTFRDVLNLKTLNLFNNKFQTVPQQLLRFQTKLEKLNLSDNPRLAHLPPDLIRHAIALTEVNFERCSIEGLPSEFFSSLVNLKTLLLGRNDIAKLLAGTFMDLKNLATLDLSFNNLTALSSSTLDGLTTLETLLLPNNRLADVEGAFGELRKLVKLDLKFNQLTSLAAGTLSGLANLEILQLSNNHLAHIDEYALFEMVNVKSVDLSSNELQSIPGKLFSRTSSLVELNLAKNNLTHSNSRERLFELPEWMKKINLSRNVFSALPTLPFLSELSHLESVDLSHNSLSSFNYSDCQPVSDQLVLDLRYNRIATADIEAPNVLAGEIAELPERPSRPRVLLGNNPFVCDCNAKNLVQYNRKQMSRSYPYTIDLDNLKCEGPAEVATRQLSTLTMRNLVCDDVPDCPAPCMCRKFAMGNLVVNCTQLGLAELPTKAPYNVTNLVMSGNSIIDVIGIENERWANLHELILDGNRIKSLANTTGFPTGLTLLGLANNSLQSLSQTELDLLNAYPRMRVDLRSNPWRCDCNGVQLKHWLSENVGRVRGAVSDVLCADAPERPLYLENLCPTPGPENPRAVLVGVTVVGLLLAAGVAAAAIGYYHFQHEIKVWLYARGWCLWFVTAHEVDRNKTYDAFISFSQEDSDFVASHLLPGLERPGSTPGVSGGGGPELPSYRVCIHYRDWLAGEWIPDQIARSVQESRRTIVVLSKNFIQSVWGRLEFKAAHHQALQDRTNRLIVVVFGDLPPVSEMDPELKLYVKFNTYLKWGDPWFWQKLRYAMPHRPLRASGPAPPHLPLPRRAKNKSSKVPTSFTTQSPPSPIVNQTRVPMTTCLGKGDVRYNGNGDVKYNVIANDKLELVCL